MRIRICVATETWGAEWCRGRVVGLPPLLWIKTLLCCGPTSSVMWTSFFFFFPLFKFPENSLGFSHIKLQLSVSVCTITCSEDLLDIYGEKFRSLVASFLGGYLFILVMPVFLGSRPISSKVILSVAWTETIRPMIARLAL